MQLVEIFNNEQGPLPIKKSIEVGTAKNMVLFASGSARRSADVGIIECEILLDGLVVASMKVWTNEEQSHKALVPVFKNLTEFDRPKANFEIRVKDANTLTDLNDFFNLSISLQG